MKVGKRVLRQLINEVINEQSSFTDPDAPQTMMGTDQLTAIAAKRGLNNVAGDLERLAGQIQKAVASQDNQGVIDLAQRVKDASMDLYNIVMAAKSEVSGDEGTYQQSRGSRGGRYTPTSDVEYDSGGRPM